MPGPISTWACFSTIAGSLKSALAHLNEAIRLQPDDVPMLWQTAWILATSPDASVRDGARAVELATRAIELSDGQEPRAFDALAAALAETGEFSAAVDAAEQASTIALTRGDDGVGRRHPAAGRLYRQGLPYRQSARTGRPRKRHWLIKWPRCRLARFSSSGL